MAFYDICQMTSNVINYAYMGIKRSVLIRQNDLRDLESFYRNKMLEKIQKTKMPIFPLYFGVKSFENLIMKC